MPDLADAADPLYAQLPARFIAERTAAAKRAKAEGAKDFAAEIGRLPKPSVGAWAVNALVRSKAELMEGFLSLGETLREAQEDLDSDALRELVGQRRRLVAQLAAEAEKLGDELGQKVGPNARDEVEQTLQAALADADAASAVMTGRLVRALSSTGFDAVDLDGAVAGGSSDARPSAKAARADKPSADSAATAPNDIERARAKREKELADRAAEKESADAARETAAAALADAETRAQQAAAHRDDLRATVARLQKELDEAEERLTASASAARRTASEREDAADSLAQAERAALRAEERLAALQRRR